MKNLVLSLLMFGLASSAVGAREGGKPNIILISCDDLGYGDLGVHGHPTIRTPHIDRMAAEGQRWTSFYSAASVCTPSRAALLTGRLAIRSGMIAVLFPNSKSGLPQSEVTVAELLKDAGYATGIVGKWHLGHEPEFLPLRHGFDSYWGIPYSNDMDRQRGFPNYREEARKDPDYVAPIQQYDVPILDDEREVERPADQNTLTGRYNAKAVEFIRAHRAGPFFLYLAHSLPHIPLYAGEDRLGESRRGLYGDVVEEIDAGIGKILAELEELGLGERTLVVFTSDNGPWLTFDTHGGSAGLLREGKGTTFEGGMRVPGLFWWPGVVEPGVVMDPGSQMDLLPTFCAFAGAKAPSDRPLDGHDLSGVLKGEEDRSPTRQVFFWQRRQVNAVRSGPWKLHFITREGFGGPRKTLEKPLLYHLDTDPSEKHDVAAYHPDKVAELRQLAEQHVADVEKEEDRRSEVIKGD